MAKPQGRSLQESNAQAAEPLPCPVPSGLTLRLFGPFRAQLDDQPLTGLRTPRDSVLLALLTLCSDHPVEREWLAATLWPDSDATNARYYLRRSLAALRRALGPHAWRLVSPTLQTLQFELKGTDCDLHDFNAAVARQDTASLQTAVTLYTAPLLQGNLEAWSESARQECDQAAQQALWTLAEQALAHGEAPEATRWLRRLLELDPLQEQAQRQLLRALAHQGYYAAMAQTYRTFRLLLHEELRASPDAETTALYQQLRQQAEQAPPPLLQTAFATCAPQPILRLPHPLTPLVGRREAVRELETLLTSHRLLTLTGIGGVGKTRLAVAVAQTQIDIFPDGIWFVDLSGLRDATFVAQAVAQALELTVPSDQSPLELLVQHLRSRRLLLVLDNCEHLLEACGELARCLLEACGGLKALATSRQPLGLPGEVCWPVPSLDCPEREALQEQAKDLVSVVAEYEAVELFVQRARQAHPAFKLTAHNAVTVARVCQRLDGIPLAIELAAAKVRYLPMEQLVEGLDDRFRLLQGDRGAMLPRQQTLRAMVDWSWDLLLESEKILLARLSVFTGGWTVEALEAVCTTPAVSHRPTEGAMEETDGMVLHAHSSLISKSLIAVEAWSGQTRYRLLETIGQYAAERLAESGEAETFRQRHCAYYVALTEGASDHVQGVDAATWIARYEAEHDNLRAAIAWSLEAQNAGRSLRLTGNLAMFWSLRGYAAEGRKLLARALALPESNTEGTARLQALDNVWWLAFIQKDLEAAQDYCRDLERQARTHNDRFYLAIALNGLGILAEFRNHDFVAARGYFEEAVAVYRMFPDGGRSHAVLLNLGTNATLHGDYAASQAYLLEALELSRRKGDREIEMVCLHGLGVAFQESNAHEQAQAYFDRALDLSRVCGFKQRELETRICMVELLLDQSDFTQARQMSEATLALCRKLQDTRREHAFAALLGHALAELGETAAAWSYLSRALRALAPQTQTLDVVQYTSQCLEAFCVLARVEGRTLRATRLLAVAQTLRQANNSTIPPNIRLLWQRLEKPLRETLGDQTFAAVWTEGQMMPRPQALAYALEPSTTTEPIDA